MSVLVVADPRVVDHDTGRGHPESPARYAAAVQGVSESGLIEAIEFVVPESCDPAAIVAVHDRAMVDAVESACRVGGFLDADTPVVPKSWEAALVAAGAGLTAVDHLASGDHEGAFCIVRPPGHHATRAESMGFCLFNNIAVTARALTARGERVLIADVDAHHGNGTQDIFYDDPDVLFVSWHQWPLYPGTGALSDIGGPGAVGTTINLPMPPGATGDRYRRAFDEVVAPAIARFAPTWLLVSAGYDAHRSDPLTSLGLTSGDYADLVSDLMATVGAGRTVCFLEGGYDLAAVTASTSATISALAGEPLHPETPTGGGPGDAVVDAIVEFHRREGVLAPR
jgi:acetoin utilization deacetylase AcuC-like enzyme